MSGIASVLNSSPASGGAHGAFGGHRAPPGRDFGSILNSQLQPASQSTTGSASDVQLLQALSQASNLIGKTITYSKPGTDVTAKASCNRCASKRKDQSRGQREFHFARPRSKFKFLNL